MACVSGWALSWRSGTQQLRRCPLTYLVNIQNSHATYQNLEPVQQRGRICQAAVLLVGGVVLRDVTICPSAQKDLFNAAREGVTQILHRVHHDTTIDGGAWEKEEIELSSQRWVARYSIMFIQSMRGQCGHTFWKCSIGSFSKAHGAVRQPKLLLGQ